MSSTLHRRRTQFVQERATKTNPMYAGLTAIADMPQPRTMPRNYKNYAQEGYAANDTLYKVIVYGIQNGAAIPPKLYTDRTMQKEIPSHALLDKLAMPNPEMDGVFYREAVLGYYLIAGNSFQYMVRVAKIGPPDELWLLEPDKVRPIPDEKRGIATYEVDYFPKEKNPVQAALIGHLRTWNPKDPFFGLSPVEVAAILVDQQTAIRKWNLALLQNFAKPPGAWTTTALLDYNTRQKLEAQIAEKMAGYRNAGKAPVLDGGLTWTPQALSPSDLDWLEGAKYNAGGIANIYNMPPQLIGDTSSTTYDNMQEAKAASYTEYIFPMLDKLYSLWNRWLVPTYPDLAHAYLYYDKESVEVVQQVIQSRLTAASQRANASWSAGAASTCTLNEAREMLGLSPDPQGDVYRFGAVIVPKGKLEAYAEQSLTKPAGPPMLAAEPLNVDPTPPPASQEGNNDASRNNSDQQQSQPTRKPDAQSARHENGNKARVLRGTKALNLRTTEEKSAYAASVEATRKRHEAVYQKQIAGHFDTERTAIVAAIRGSSAMSALAGRAEGALNKQDAKLRGLLLDLYQTVALDVGNTVFDALLGKQEAHKRAQRRAYQATMAALSRLSTKDDGSDDSTQSEFVQLFGDKQLRYLQDIAGQKITQVSDTTLSQVRQALSDGVEQGESIPQIAARIDALYLDQIIPNRSTVIARTEVVSSSNWASMQAAQASGLTLTKVWLATGDNRTRPAHLDADGQEVSMDEPFEVGGEALDYPGDPSGSAGNIIDCRCTLYYKDASGTNVGEDAASEGGFDDALAGLSLDEKAAQLAGPTSAWLGTLTEGERAAIVYYTGSAYRRINGYLRGDSRLGVISQESQQSLQATIDQAQTGLLKSKAPFDMVVQRGYGRSQLDNFLHAAQNGGWFQEQGFASTTIKDDRDFPGFCASIKVFQGAEGAYVQPISGVPGEQEFLLPHGAQFKVVGAQQDPDSGIWTFEVEYRGGTFGPAEKKRWKGQNSQAPDGIIWLGD